MTSIACGGSRPRQTSSLSWLATLLMLSFSGPARAVDGVTEINQASALAGGSSVPGCATADLDPNVCNGSRLYP